MTDNDNPLNSEKKKAFILPLVTFGAVFLVMIVIIWMLLARAYGLKLIKNNFSQLVNALNQKGYDIEVTLNANLLNYKGISVYFSPEQSLVFNQDKLNFKVGEINLSTYFRKDGLYSLLFNAGNIDFENGIKIKNIKAAMQQNDDETYDAKIDIRHVELLEGKSWNMSTALEEIYVEMSTTKKFSSNGSFYDSLLTWQKDGGRFEVQRTIVNWAPLVLVGKGKIAFNGQLEPSISLMTTSKGAEQTLDNLGNAQIFDSKNVFVAKILLSAKQKEWEAQGNKEGTFSLPISYSDGQFNIENISMLPQDK